MAVNEEGLDKLSSSVKALVFNKLSNSTQLQQSYLLKHNSNFVLKINKL